MKLAICSAGPGLDDDAHDLFGRCDYFLIIDLETGETKAVKNEFAASSTGAGTACAQIIFNEGVEAVVSGKAGPNAYEVLKQAGIDIFLLPPGLKVKDALEKYKAGSLRKMEITQF